MTPDKIRIYELAKQLNLSNKEVMSALENKMSITVKSHSSSISAEEAEKVTKLLKPKTEKPAPTPAKTSPAATPVKPIVTEEKAPQKEFNTQNDVRQNPPRQGENRPYQQNQGGNRPYPSRQGENRPYQPRPQGENRPYQQNQGENRPYQPRPQGENRPYQQNQGENRPYQPRPQGENRPYQQNQGENRPYQPRPQGENRPYQQNQGENRPYPPRTPYQGANRSPVSDKVKQALAAEKARKGRPPFRPAGQEGQPQQVRPQGNAPTYPRAPQQGGQGGTYGQPRFPQGGQPGSGPRPFNNFGNRPSAPSSSAPPDELNTKTARKDFGSKKKDVKNKDNVYTKQEKFEQVKVLQQAKYKKKNKSGIEEKAQITEVVLDKTLTVGDLSEKLNISASEIVKYLMMSGIMATVNQTIDIDTAKKTAENFEIAVVEKLETAEEEVVEEEKIIDQTNLVERAPVVTIMGHVDHGKTTLLDSIRSSKHKIVNTEVGGITQSIGAYTVEVNNKKIVFLDTPGHEAFTAMRARGAKSTDLAILVVAADDGIMPQTIEAINHAKAAKVPIIVAVNKIDKPDADADRVLQQLMEYDLVPEKWGGDVVCVPVSALQQTNLDELLDYIILISEVEELRANPNQTATGVVIEAKLDKGKGPVATLLVQDGTLNVGDCVVVGQVGGKVRALITDKGERVKSVGPSTPVEILGLTEVPQAGDAFEIAPCERDMKSIISDRRDIDRETRLEALAPSNVRREMLMAENGETQDLNIIVKANTHGSAEAVSAAIQQLKSKEIFVKIVHIGVGDISEADVMLASASNSTIMGFSVKEDANVARIAADEGIKIKKYDIIYKILEDIERDMLGLLQPEVKEVEIGKVEVRQVFTVGKTNKIAGCFVLEGKVVRNKTGIVERDGKEIYKGNIDQLKRFKEDAKEVATGFECGLSFNKFNDIEEGDIIKIISVEESERIKLV